MKIVQVEIIEGEEYRLMYCQVKMSLENVTILGIYEPWPQGNPVLAANPIYSTWTLLSEEQQITLIDKDHVYLGITVDRSLLPTASISAAETWLTQYQMTCRSRHMIMAT